MFEVAWEEFKKDSIVCKTKEFKSEQAMQRFIEKLVNKDNFYRVLGTR